MNIPAFKRILKTDYAQQFQAMIDSLSYSINNAIESLNNAMKNNISLQDNILCTVKTLSVQVDSNGKPTTALSFPLSFTGQALGLTVLNAVNQTNSISYPSTAVYINWTQTQNGIQINTVTGLTAMNNYNITVVAWGSG